MPCRIVRELVRILLNAVLTGHFLRALSSIICKNEELGFEVV
jgi:hypothetical protein